MYCYSFFDFYWFKPVKPCLCRKKANLPNSGHKLQFPPKKFEAPGNENYMTLFNGVLNHVGLFPSKIPTLSTKEWEVLGAA